jgi:predicted Holliday junction resolvase-like endonuclease
MLLYIFLSYSMAEIGIALGIVTAVLGLLGSLVKTVWNVGKQLVDLKAAIDLRFTELQLQAQENRASSDVVLARILAREDAQASKEWTEKRIREAIDEHCRNCLNSPDHSKVG